MSLVSLILPCGKQYRLSTSKNAIACLNQLQQKGELEGRISGDTFVVRKAFKRKLRRLFSPEVQGLLTAQQPETVIQVVTAPSASAASLINSILSTLVGVAVGLLASSVLVPSTVPKVYALLWTALVPILVITAAAMISRLVAKKDAQFVLTQIADCFESHWSPDPNGIAVSIHNTARQQIMTGSVACLVFIAISSFTNSMIERCWIAGNFEKVESFCRPATQIVETLIGADNIVAEECRFPLAEALRVVFTKPTCLRKIRISKEIISFWQTIPSALLEFWTRLEGTAMQTKPIDKRSNITNRRKKWVPEVPC
jgi:hypothetical protein